MIDILLKGIGVGLAVAAPVGPLGLLCIKRTLTQGHAVGLATGLGIATADATYGIMVAAGLAVTGLLVSYATPMQIIGGLLIAWLGTQSLRAFLRPNPAGHAARAAEARNIPAAFASAYALTLSNPMTILAFVALVAGLGASAASSPGAPYILVIGVFTGSALWWLTLTTVTRIIHSKISTQTIRWLDLVSGIVLIAWGLWISASALLG